MNDQIIRQFQILKTLPRHPRMLTIPDIQTSLANEGIKVTLRTLQRDMVTLSEVFVGIDNSKDADRSVGWFWSENAPVMNLSGLTITQALSFSLVKKYLTPLFPRVTLDELEPFFEQAESTLEGLQHNPLLAWPKKIAVVQPTQPLLPAHVDSEVQSGVSKALLANEQVAITYRRLDGVKQRYDLNPLGLVLRNGVTYLIASKAESNELRNFVLHRISQVTRSYRDAVRPAQFDLQTYINEGHMGFNLTGEHPFESITLVAIFDKLSIQHLRETRLSEDQHIEQVGDDAFKITATVQETEQLFWWLLSFGFRVEVMEPLALREKMANSVKVLATKYAV